MPSSQQRYSPEQALAVLQMRSVIVKESMEWLDKKSLPIASVLGAHEKIERVRTMGKIPADEIDGAEPEARFEPFFLACMLKLGDPDTGLEQLAPKFYVFLREYFANQTIKLPDRATMLVQYVIWYERESRRSQSSLPVREFLP